jgi:hypothetical protein
LPALFVNFMRGALQVIPIAPMGCPSCSQIRRLARGFSPDGLSKQGSIYQMIYGRRVVLPGEVRFLSLFSLPQGFAFASIQPGGSLAGKESIEETSI